MCRCESKLYYRLRPELLEVATKCLALVMGFRTVRDFFASHACKVYTQSLNEKRCRRCVRREAMAS